MPGTFESVRFTVEGEAEAANGPAAKEALRPVYDRARAALAKLEEEEGLVVTEGSRRSTNAVAIVPQYRRQGDPVKPPSYAATFLLSFATADVDRASKVHDALTSLEGVSVPNPEFVVAHSDDLEEQALIQAVANARAAFARQCKALGLEAGDFEVVSTQAGDRGHRIPAGVQMSAALESASPEPMEVQPDRPEISCEITLTFARTAASATPMG